MRLACTRLVLALAAIPGLALAQETEAGSPWAVEGTVAVVSDSMWRGISQTDNSPGAEAEITLSHDSGLYAGAWVANVDFGDPGDGIDYEVDVYLGWSTEMAEGVALDVSATRARYPGTNAGYESDYTEFAAGLVLLDTYTVSVAYSPDIFQLGGSGIYYNAAAEYALGDSGYGLKLSTGWYDLDSAAGDSYGDYLVGVTRSFGPIDAELAWTNTFSYSDILSENLDDADKADGRVSLRLGWAF